MQVILLKQVLKLGNRGDVKDVAAGFFRNFLLPRGLAKPATPAGLAQAERMREAAALRAAERSEEFTNVLHAIKQEPIVVLRKANEEGHLFGSVSEKAIADVLRSKGYGVEDRHVALEVPIKSLGAHSVLLQFNEDIKDTISIEVEREE